MEILTVLMVQHGRKFNSTAEGTRSPRPEEPKVRVGYAKLRRSPEGVEWSE